MNTHAHTCITMDEIDETFSQYRRHFVSLVKKQKKTSLSSKEKHIGIDNQISIFGCSLYI